MTVVGFAAMPMVWALGGRSWVIVVMVVVFSVLALGLWALPDPAVVRLARVRGPQRRSRLGELRRALSWQRPGRISERWRVASIELCHGLGAELAAGRTPGEALSRAVRGVDFPDADLLRPILAAARDGGDVPAAMIAAAPVQGGDGLRRLAACWQVNARTGAALSVLVDRVGVALRTAESHRKEVAAQLAGPRSSARLLAALPLLGLLLGAGLGMRPLHFLFGSPAGLLCLFLGISLNACGLWWTHRLMIKAQGS